MHEKVHVPPIGGSLSPLQTVPTPWTLALTRPLHHRGRLRCCVINWEAPCIDSQTFHGPDRLRGYCLTNGAVWHRDDNGSSLFRQHKNRAPEMFRRIRQNVITRSYQADQKETIFDFRTFRLLWLGWGFFFPPLASSFLRARMLQVSAGAHYSLDNEVWTYWTQTQNNWALRPPSSSSICDRELFVSSALPLGVCLPDTCPAWPSFSLISSVSVETCEGHLPISLCESLPARCLCQQFGDWLTARRYPLFALGPTGQRQHVSPNRHPHLHGHKSLSTRMPGQTTRHVQLQQLTVQICRDIKLWLFYPVTLQQRLHAYSLYLTSKCPLCFTNVSELWHFYYQRLKRVWLKALTEQPLIAVLFGNEFAFKISLFVLNDSAANVGGGHINNFKTLVGKTGKWSRVK